MFGGIRYTQSSNQWVEPFLELDDQSSFSTPMVVYAEHIRNRTGRRKKVRRFALFQSLEWFCLFSDSNSEKYLLYLVVNAFFIEFL